MKRPAAAFVLLAVVGVGAAWHAIRTRSEAAAVRATTRHRETLVIARVEPGATGSSVASSGRDGSVGAPADKDAPDQSLAEQVQRHVRGDVAAALRWIAALPATERVAAAEAAVRELERTDPAGALEIAEFFGLGAMGGRVEHIVQLWTEENPRAAVNWVKSRSPGADRDRLAARAAWVLAQREPGSALQLVADTVTNPAAQENARLAVVRQWALRDAAGATAEVTGWTDAALRTRAMYEIEVARRAMSAR